MKLELKFIKFETKSNWNWNKMENFVQNIAMKLKHLYETRLLRFFYQNCRK